MSFLIDKFFGNGLERRAKFSYLEKNGAAEGTRTPDPIITNDVLYQLSYSGFVDPTMALLVLLMCREPCGFASHSSRDPLITNDVLYQLSYSGILLSAGQRRTATA